MKRFFEEHTSVVIICIVISLLLCIIGSIKGIGPSETSVEGGGLLKIVGDNLTDTIDTYQKQINPNENLLKTNSLHSYSENSNYFEMNGTSPAFSTKEINGKFWATPLISASEFSKFIKPNTKYTMSFDYEITKAANRTIVPYDLKIGFLFYSPGNYNKYREFYIVKYQTIGKKMHYQKTITTPQTIPNDYQIIMYSNRYAKDETPNNADYDTVRFTNIKLEEGTKATPYNG